MAGDAKAEVVAIHEVDQAFVKAYNANDIDKVMKLYTDNAGLLPPGAPRAIGRAAIRAYFTTDMAQAAKDGAKFVLGANPDGGISGDWGWSSGTFAVTDQAGHVIDRGKYLSVSKKVDGKWLYVEDMWNSDAAPAPAEPAVSQKK
jgi:ketosteroid isomerase-like protein